MESTGFPFSLKQSVILRILRTDVMKQTDLLLELFSLNTPDNHCLCLLEFLGGYWDIPVFFWGLEAQMRMVLFLEAKANCNCSFCFMATREIPQLFRKWKTFLGFCSHGGDLHYFRVFRRNVHGLGAIENALLIQRFPEEIWAIPPKWVLGYVLYIKTMEGIVCQILVCFHVLLLIGCCAVTYLLDSVDDKCLEALCIVRDLPNNDL